MSKYNERLEMRISKEAIEVINNYRKEHKYFIPSKAEAVRQLLEIGLREYYKQRVINH